MRDSRPKQRAAPARRKVTPPEQFLVRQPWKLLEPLLSHGPNPARAMERIRAYASLLMEWNQGVSNLISQNDQARFVERHLAESLAGLPRLRELDPAHVVDLGSGGGLPAIPLLLAGAGRRWTLVESRRNKTLFLRRVAQDLSLGNLTVLTGRLETLLDSDAEALACDAFTSRATLSLGPTLEMAARIVSSGGHALLWKGSSWAQEFPGGEVGAPRADGWEFIGATTIGEGPNVIVEMKRDSGS